MSIGSDLKKFGRLVTGSTPDPEAARLTALEAVVDAGLESFIKVGTALAEIRDSKLYRVTHNTFSTYVEDRFGFSARRAYQLITAAATAETVKGISQFSPTEPQAAQLAKLPVDQQPAAWAEAVTNAEGNPTAATVAEIVAAKSPRKAKKKKAPPKAIRIKVPGGIVILERRTADVDPMAMLSDAITKQGAELDKKVAA